MQACALALGAATAAKLDGMLAPLCDEAALLRRLLYRNRLQLGRDAHYQRLRRALQTVDRFVAMALPALFARAAACFPPLPPGVTALHGKELPAPGVLQHVFHRLCAAVALADAAAAAFAAAATGTLRQVAKQLFAPFNVTMVALAARAAMCLRALRVFLSEAYGKAYRAALPWVGAGAAAYRGDAVQAAQATAGLFYLAPEALAAPLGAAAGPDERPAVPAVAATTPVVVLRHFAAVPAGTVDDAAAVADLFAPLIAAPKRARVALSHASSSSDDDESVDDDDDDNGLAAVVAGPTRLAVPAPAAPKLTHFAAQPPRPAVEPVGKRAEAAPAPAKRKASDLDAIFGRIDRPSSHADNPPKKKKKSKPLGADIDDIFGLL